MPAACELGEDCPFGEHQNGPSDDSRSDLETPSRAEVAPSATEGLEGSQIFDVVQKPVHYNSHPSGVECIQITEHMNYLLGNAIKYIWRADLKGKPVQDLEKAVFYIQREIALRKRHAE